MKLIYCPASVLMLALVAALPLALHGRADDWEDGGSPVEPALVESRELPGMDIRPPDLSGTMDTAALGRQIDSVVEAQLEAFSLPGAAVAVVHRGEVLHSRGYGLADIEAGRLFDSRTVFRTASVSKLLTAIAVMQLVEQGLIDLDEDVREYLDIPVPDNFPAPVTMLHLLTHTAGFDDRMLGSSASKRRPADTIPLREFLTSRDAAPRVRPPGKVISYSNHGMAMAGYVVERLSGKSFENYIDEQIHGPLGMTRSTFLDPPPAHLAEDRVMAYIRQSGGHEALPITHENGAPAGSQFSTADDMARFMLANLGDGSLDGARIMEPGTLRRLHATAFTHHPLLPGWTHGFMEYHWNGRRLVGHGGDLPGYHNQLSLLPEEELGVFVHYNGTWDVNLDDDPRMRVVEAVLTALVPAEAGAAPPRAPDEVARVLPAADGAASVAGNYRLTRHARTSMEKLLLPNSFLRLHVREDRYGGLHVNMPLGLVEPSEWVSVAPMLYKRAGGDDYLVFEADGRGRASHLFGTFMIPLAFERVGWYESELLLLGFLAFPALTFLVVTVGWPVRAAVRRIRRISGPTPCRGRVLSRDRRRRVVLTRGVALLGGLVVVILAVMIVQVMSLGDTPLLSLQPLLGAMAICCGLSSLWLAIMAWPGRGKGRGRGDGPLPERLGQLVVALAGVLFLWQMGYWNVLGF